MQFMIPWKSSWNSLWVHRIRFILCQWMAFLSIPRKLNCLEAANIHCKSVNIRRKITAKCGDDIVMKFYTLKLMHTQNSIKIILREFVGTQYKCVISLSSGLHFSQSYSCQTAANSLKLCYVISEKDSKSIVLKKKMSFVNHSISEGKLLSMWRRHG